MIAPTVHADGVVGVLGVVQDAVQDLRHSIVTATNPARHGSIPIQPSSGGRPVSPEVSLTSSPVSATEVPSANIAVAAQRAHRLPRPWPPMSSRPS